VPCHQNLTNNELQTIIATVNSLKGKVNKVESQHSLAT
jgi:hypothetical protein